MQKQLKRLRGILMPEEFEAVHDFAVELRHRERELLLKRAVADMEIKALRVAVARLTAREVQLRLVHLRRS